MSFLNKFKLVDEFQAGQGMDGLDPGQRKDAEGQMQQVKNLGSCLAVFVALIFFGWGAWYAVWSFHTLWTVKNAQGWVETEAHVVNCELKEWKTPKGKKMGAATAEYRYTYDGKEYTSDRPCIPVWKPNNALESSILGRQPQEAFQMLDEARKAGAPVPCRVNPKSPEQAALYWTPNLVWLVFKQFLVFALCGLGLVLFTVTAVWRGRRELGPGRIQMEGANTHRYHKTLAVVFVPYTLAVTGFAAHVTGFETFPHWGWIPLAVPAVLVCTTMFYVARLKKFGVSMLELSTFPVTAGGVLRGVVQIPARLESPEVKATLRYIQQYSTGRRKRRRTHKQVMHEESRQFSTYAAGENATGVKVEWRMPPDRLTTASRGSNGFWWELELGAKEKGINFKAVFDVPVVKEDGGA